MRLCSFIKPVIFVVALLLPAMVAAEKDSSIAVILAVIGEAEIYRGDTIVVAQRHTGLLVGDRIHTGGTSRVQIRFADGTLTTLGGGTTLQINTYTWDNENNSSGKAGFRLLQGAFRTITGKLTTVADPDFKVETPVGVIGIRGTDFWGGYLNDDEVDVLLISGEHAVEVSNENGKVLLAKAGEGTTLYADQAAPAVKVWPQKKVDKAFSTVSWPDGNPPTE